MLSAAKAIKYWFLVIDYAFISKVAVGIGGVVAIYLAVQVIYLIELCSNKKGLKLSSKMADWFNLEDYNGDERLERWQNK